MISLVTPLIALHLSPLLPLSLFSPLTPGAGPLLPCRMEEMGKELIDLIQAAHKPATHSNQSSVGIQGSGSDKTTENGIHLG